MGGLKKEYRTLGSNRTDADHKPLTVLGAAVLAFAASHRIQTVVISVPPHGETGELAARASLPQRLLQAAAKPRIYFVPGGKTRRISVHHALSWLSAFPGETPDFVLIHDGARPWVDRSLIERTIDAVILHKAVLPLLPLIETPKEIDGSGFVCRHLARARVGTAQTPQAFAYPEILRAHEQAAEQERASHKEYTDDAEVWGEFIGPVAVIPGSPENRKITFPEDLLTGAEGGTGV
jgi:2-C-methyl-D-erythritol 4-phosphate cytidylyltransferase